MSHHVGQLEQSLGTALLYRSTRKLSLTADGERLLIAARSMIEAAEAGLQLIGDQNHQLSGVLRVTAPSVLGQSLLVDRFAEFAMANPLVQLSIDFTDVRRDLIGDGFDVAIRMGWLKDSTFMARKLFSVRRRLVAAQSYVEKRPKPNTPHDLSDWDWLELGQIWARKETFRNGDKEVTIARRASQISVNDAQALYRLTQAGAGLSILPVFLIKAGFDDGTLCDVLPDWNPSSLGVYAVWPPNAPRDGLVKNFVEFLIGM